MELESIIKTHLKYERKRIEFDPVAKEKSRVWIETIQHAPRSTEAIQALMDVKEVAMNKTENILEVRRLDWEWSALLWLQGVIQRANRHAG